MKKIEAVYEFCVDALELTIMVACTLGLITMLCLGSLMLAELLNR
jgi:hypothetical protein